MGNWIQMTIYQSGNSKGFTLLEVLVALVLFSVVFTVLIELETNHIKRVYKNYEKLKALQFFQKNEMGFNPVDTEFKVERKSSRYDNFIIEENVILNRENEEVLTIKNYRFIYEK